MVLVKRRAKRKGQIHATLEEYGLKVSFSCIISSVHCGPEVTVFEVRLRGVQEPLCQF